MIDRILYRGELGIGIFPMTGEAASWENEILHAVSNQEQVIMACVHYSTPSWNEKGGREGVKTYETTLFMDGLYATAKLFLFSTCHAYAQFSYPTVF
jgi:hypothetical protein